MRSGGCLAAFSRSPFRALVATAALPHASRGSHGPRLHPLGAAGVSSGPPVCHVRPDRGHVAAQLQREPTTDTYSLEQSQEDFYYSLHYSKLDLVLWAKNHGVSAESAASDLDYAPEQVRVYDDIDQKRRATSYLHAAPILLEPVDDLAGQAPLATQILPTSA
jgi:hypothetical protein